jgi:hypothetical protein
MKRHLPLLSSQETGGIAQTLIGPIPPSVCLISSRFTRASPCCPLRLCLTWRHFLVRCCLLFPLSTGRRSRTNSSRSHLLPRQKRGAPTAGLRRRRSGGATAAARRYATLAVSRECSILSSSIGSFVFCLSRSARASLSLSMSRSVA